MEEDELERPTEFVINPMAYAFQPIRHGNRAVVRVEEVLDPVVITMSVLCSYELLTSYKQRRQAQDGIELIYRPN